MIRLVPHLVVDALPAGSIARASQPRLDIDADLVLRPWRLSDTRMVMEAFADPAIQQWHMRRLDTEQEAVDWLVSWPQRWKAETDAAWAVARRETDIAIGYTALRGVMLSAAQAQISYWVTPSARGDGVATGASAALAQWGLGQLGLHRLYLVHSTDNPASCRIAEKIGFPLEGTLRGYMLHADGWHDMHMHARLAA
jgi:[ribosomal protein S5]-alanine N-acetyltransferase